MWMRIPTARVRSVSDVHGSDRAGLLLPREVGAGECRLVGSDVVKETILEVEQVKRVSMPSELELGLDAGVEVDRTVGRVGRVNERRVVVEPCGACSKALEEAGTDMMSASSKHRQVVSRFFVVGRRAASKGRVFVGRSECPYASRWFQGLVTGGRLEMLTWREFHTDQRTTPRCASAMSLPGTRRKRGYNFDGGLEFWRFLCVLTHQTKQRASSAFLLCTLVHGMGLAPMYVTLHKSTSRKFAARYADPVN
jgi:hypothetical protein